MVGEQDGLGTAERPVTWRPRGELGLRLKDSLVAIVATLLGMGTAVVPD